MYAQHVPVIAAACREDVHTFTRAIMFASLSIRQPVENVPAMLDDVEALASQSPYLWGWKVQTFEDATIKARELHRAQFLDTREALGVLVREVRGLGVVKAGFVLQLAGHDVACLDTRNIVREGRNPREFRVDVSPKILERTLDRYIEAVGGRAEEYWDAWCEDVARARGKLAEDISALHLAIVPDDYLPF